MTDQTREWIKNQVWNPLDQIDSPLMDQIRAVTARHAQGERAIRLLPVYRIVAVMGWLAFLAVVIVAGMR